MLKKEDNLDAELNRLLIKQFFSAYNTKQEYYWLEEEFEFIIKFCLENNKLPMLHYALSLALKYYPENADFHYSAGKYFLATNNCHKALNHFKKFLFDDPQNDFVVFEMCFCWENMCKTYDAIDVLTDYLKNFNPNSAAAWFALGSSYVNANENINAIDAFEYSLALNPESMATYFNLGNLYCLEGNYEKALLIYSEALKLDDSDAAIYSYLGECYFYLEDHENAIKYENKALELDNTCEYAYYFLARTYFKFEQFQLAEDYVNKAIDCNDQISEFYSLRAYVNQSLNNNSLAEEDYIKAINYDKYLFECYLDISIFYMQENKIELAIDMLERILEDMNEPDKTQTKYLLCACHFMTGNKQEAYRIFNTLDIIDAKLSELLNGQFDAFVYDPVIIDLIKDKSKP
ncbi:tetratricopeptide repeat protein [Bacteroidales bacterium OttesenSCG-928-K03]|nr:tetratricopeptide repeat protein [Odoribacter sp. OttesenSCG-928-L07]MDL2242637.1 tetratricopeptide repeat protein [Bacteroidales bacterium OttesenSCG-928-K03]